MSRFAWPVLALVSGALWGLCFGRQPLLLAPWVALVPLLLLIPRPGSAALGFLHGLGAWMVSIYWIAATVKTYGGLGAWLAVLLLLLLAGYLALYHAGFAWLGRRIWRRGGIWTLAGLPALWVTLEWVRAHLFSGFPWNPAAHAWIELPGALPLAAWVGVSGISYLVLWANTGLAVACTVRRWEPAALGLLVPLLLLPLGGRWGSVGGEWQQRPLAVRILQPNTSNLIDWDPEQLRRSYRKILELSRQACDRPGALLIWPESAAWPRSFETDSLFRRDVERLVERGCPVLFNTASTADGASYNSALLLNGAGTVRYDKRHLVPYGEYVPLARLLPFVRQLARNAGRFAAGGEAVLLPWEEERLGVAICFEIIFPGEVAALVRRGATLLVTITNDAWFGDTVAPWQHFRAARFRAAENRRPVLRAAITGVSGLIAADGSVRGQMGVGEEGVLRASVRGRRDLSPFSRAPWLVSALCLLGSGFAILRPDRGPRRQRPGGAPGS